MVLGCFWGLPLAGSGTASAVASLVGYRVLIAFGRVKIFAALFRVNALVALGRVNVLAVLGRVNVLAVLGRVKTAPLVRISRSSIFLRLPARASARAKALVIVQLGDRLIHEQGAMTGRAPRGSGGSGMGAPLRERP